MGAIYYVGEVIIVADRIKRFITCHVPVTVCNFSCEYCYLRNITERVIDPFVLEPKQLATKLSAERLGGTCYFNLCADGETMMHPQLIDLVSELTSYGHYVDIITNGTMTKKFDELIEKLTIDQQRHVMIKFSFHYVELKRRGLLDVFADNVNKIRKSQVSLSIEITPYDKLVDLINEIRDFSMDNFGVLPHVTVARDADTQSIDLLTRYTREEYRAIWGQFDSAMFDFKLCTFNEKRTEFCYAGEWSIKLNLGTGDYTQCYVGATLGNICDEGPIKLRAIGRCLMPHCFNGHALLALGVIPELESPTYAEERDRTCRDGNTWLKEECSQFFSSKLKESNKEYDEIQKCTSIISTCSFLLKKKIRGAKRRMRLRMER